MTKNYRNLEDRDAMQERELSGAMVTDMTGDELEKILSARADGERLDLSRRMIRDTDLSGVCLDNIDF